MSSRPDEWSEIAYLFSMAASSGHAGLWMVFKGVYQPGLIVCICAGVVFAVFLGILPDDEDQAEG